MVSSLHYLSPSAKAKADERQQDINAMLIARKAVREQRMGAIAPPPLGDGGMPPNQAMPGPVAGAPPMPGAPATPPMLDDPANDPTIPPPTPPAAAVSGGGAAAGMGAGFPPSSPFPAPMPQTPRFAGGGVTGGQRLLPGVVPAEMILDVLARAKNGEGVDPMQYNTVPMDTGETIPENPRRTPGDIPKQSGRTPPQRFVAYLDGLTAENATGEWEQDLVAARDAGADSYVLWETVREAVNEGDSDLPPVWQDLVKGKQRGPERATSSAKKPMMRLEPPKVG